MASGARIRPMDGIHFLCRALMRFSALRRPDAIRPLAEAQAEYAAAALAAAGGNKSRAAALLGIDRKTLRTLLARPRDPA